MTDVRSRIRNGYEKFLSYDNHQLKYNPSVPKITRNKTSKHRTPVFAYDALKNEIVSAFPVIPLPDFSDSVIFTRQMVNNQSSVFRYCRISEIYMNQLNGYRYCWNNPLKYTDPNGNGFEPFTWTLIGVLAGFLYHELLSGFHYTGVAYEFWRDRLESHLKYLDEVGVKSIGGPM